MIDERATYAAGTIAAALGITPRAVRDRAAREGWTSVSASTRGGRSAAFPAASLPDDVRTAVIAQGVRLAERKRADAAESTATNDARREAMWSSYVRAPTWQKRIAESRHDALREVERVARDDRVSITEARRRVSATAGDAGQSDRSLRTLRRLANVVRRIPRADWLPALLPENRGRPDPVAIHPALWMAFKADYLRLEQPTAESCYRRIVRRAQGIKEWQPVPCLKSLMRRLSREVPKPVIVAARKGTEAMMAMGPPIRRKRDDLAALEVVNADGHLFDVAVRFPDDSIGRPVIIGWQDVYSGKLLSYRLARSETADAVRLAFCDMVQRFGIPKRAHLDNGRAFASKSNTGGVATRYRYKVREDDPLGVLPRLGVGVHWVTPYNGKAKPIERAWADLASDLSKRPEFAGAYLGNNPTAKPENYGSRAIAWDEFERVVADGIAEHNARSGRRSAVANGRSFDEAFATSYASQTVTKATRDQLAMLLLPSETVKLDARSGEISYAGNRYWSEATCQMAGQRVELRFDPSALHVGVHVFAPGGHYLGFVDCIAAHGWNESEAMREAIRRRKDWRRKQRAFLKAEQALHGAMFPELPAIPESPLPPPAAVRMFNPKPRATGDADGHSPAAPTDFEVFFLDRLRSMKQDAL